MPKKLCPDCGARMLGNHSAFYYRWTCPTPGCGEPKLSKQFDIVESRR